MFYDLNVNVKNSQNKLDEILEQLVTFGYRGVALTTDVDDSAYMAELARSRRKNKNEDNDPVPPPTDTKQIKQKYPRLQIYTRINVILASADNIRRILQSKYIKQYDLLSFQPITQSVLKALAGIADIDIVSYNPESKNTLSLSRKLYNQFVHQNVYFELVYAPGIVSQSARKNLISLSHTYHAVGKSRNIIVSSGANSPTHIRGPYDVMNFNLLFGLSEDQAKRAISKTCDKLLMRARKQKRGKAMFEILQVSMDRKDLDLVRKIECYDVEPMEE